MTSSKTAVSSDALIIGNYTFESRLFTGTGKFSSAAVMAKTLLNSGSQMATMAIKRVDFKQSHDDILTPLKAAHIKLLPNTSGAKTAEEALFAAELAREALQTNWVKLEIHPDARYLMPDAIETLKAAEKMVAKGFIVLPYCHADPVLCKQLEEIGCAAVMPLAAPIGSNKGLVSRDFLRIIIEQARVPVIIDAGIGAPSHAAEAMEMGAAAVLVNTAMATAQDPVAMGMAFKNAVLAGRQAYLAGLPSMSHVAQASSPLTSFIKGLS
jgi:thiazole synthase